MRREKPMSIITYKIVEHDGGWAYKLGDVFSETVSARGRRRVEAAKMVAAEQRVPGKTEAIEYEDNEGKWHEELARGDDRPITDVMGVARDKRQAVVCRQRPFFSRISPTNRLNR